MGKTAPSYRMALEFEIERWKGFPKALTSEGDREAFEELMDMCRNNAMASGRLVTQLYLSQWLRLFFWCSKKGYGKLRTN